MRYHWIINGFSEAVVRQMEEQNAFKDSFLKGMEEGESYLLCRGRADAQTLETCVAGKLVLLIGACYSPEGITERLAEEAKPGDLYLFGSGYSGNELAVRLAERTGGSSVVSVHGMEAGEHIAVRKMVYANHMEGIFRMKKGPYVVSLANGLEQKPLDGGGFSVERELSCKEREGFILSREVIKEETCGGLTEAKVVIAAGRGVKSKENMEILEETAKALGGELGVSRPAAMNAWAPMHKLIGVSGKMLRPDICIVVGISGAAAFYAGIEKSRFIVAVNTDEKASIMKKADVAVADDFLPVIRALGELAERQHP